jgi:type II secretory pathway component PulF
MSAYQYTAWTTQGLRRGVLERGDSQEVARWMESQGWVPVEVQACRAAARSAPRSGGRGPKLLDLVMLSRQLEVLTNAGVPLVRALSVAEEQTPNPKLARSLTDVRRSIEQGSLLSEAMEARPRIFPEIFVNLIRAGEMGGLLPEMLARLGQLLEYESATRQKIRSASFYPTIVIAELGLAFLVLIKVVLPKFVGLFQGLGAKLPLPTRLLLVLNTTVEKYGLVMCAALGLVIGGGWLFLRTPRGRDARDAFLLEVPILGPIFHKTAQSRFARILSALLSAGIPLLSALDVAARASGNRSVERAIQKGKQGVTEGRPLAEALGETGVISPLMIRMTSVGEETGNLDILLDRASGYFDSEVDYAVKNLATAIEPILLVVLGAFVLFVALAVFMPMWDMMSAFKK